MALNSPARNGSQMTPSTDKKAKRRDKTNLGPDFVAPDGGWAWMVCVASGFSSFCIFPAVQQYGIIYRERMYDLGFDAKQITTILNSELALAAITGIVNGALFRRFTFRQVALVGGFLVFLGVLLSAFCKTFIQYLICFSLLYGVGLGANLSATALAVNTYFKTKRRRATGFSSTIIGLGPIVLPYLCTLLLNIYGTEGTIVILSGLALNTLVCGCILQPVMWHVKKKNRQEEMKVLSGEKDSKESETIITVQCKYCQNQSRDEANSFPVPYLFNEDDPEHPDYEINETGAPMLAQANDGWFGSKNSVASMKNQRRLKNEENSKNESNYFHTEWEEREVIKNNSQDSEILHCTCKEERRALIKTVIDDKESLEVQETEKLQMTFKQKVIKFFDLDLLIDVTFLNIVQGMTVMMFCELNFSFLTPFILASYGYTNEMISLAMSLLASVDIIVRFTAPLVLEKVKLSNKFLFAFGIVILLIGRVFVTLVKSFYVMLCVFLVMGFGKGFRTIFSPLIIPSYVPLARLAGASGLQLFLNALFTLAVGPLLGLVADMRNYTVTIHFMNFLTTVSLSLWLLEWLIRKLKKRTNKATDAT